MAYSTLADILDAIDERALIQLTDDEDTGEVNAARVEKAIADADEEINGYVGSRYAVPLSPVPALLRKLSVDIAIYNLHGRLDHTPEERSNRYKNAVKILDNIALGKVSLGTHDPEGNPPATDAPEFSSDNPARNFTRDSMKGF